jgi:flagella basal body P-ring formation protein FlgA
MLFVPLVAVEPAFGANPIATGVKAGPRNDTVVVNRPFIRLGDLFAEAGDKADVTVAYAPAPGGRVVYDVKALASLARANGVPWQARSWFDRVVIERPSIVIGDAEVMAAVRAELAKRNLDAKAEIELATRGINLQLPADAPPKLEIQSFQFDERSEHFSGTLVVPSTDGTQTLPVSGRLYRTIEVPTLSRRIDQGETIRRDDIQMQPMRSEAVPRNVVMDPGKIVGMEAKRGLSPDQPLRMGDVRAPLIVTKGSLVTMVVQSPTMTLTAKGKAMDNAALGESVRIQNLQSKVIVEGEVVSAGTVRIASAQPSGF